jgi:hypothetical protein
MGPIEKKINEYLELEGLSDDTIAVLNNLVEEIKLLEKEIINDSYYNGFTDKERGKNPSWDQYSLRYRPIYQKIEFGELK